jgi:hypothetical protein
MPAARLVLACAVALAAVTPARAALDPYLPADTQTYAALDLRKLLDTPLFKTHVLPHAKEALKAVPKAGELLTEIGLDPFKHLDRLVFSSPGGTDTDRGLLIVHGTFDAAKLKAFAARVKKEKDEAVKIHETPLGGGVKHDIYEIALPGTDMALFVSVASAKTVLLSPGKDYVIDALKQVKAGKKPALKSKEMQELIDGLDPKCSLAVAVQGKFLAGIKDHLSLLPEKLINTLEGVEGVGGGITVGEECKFDLAITTKDAENARAMRDGMKLAVNLGVAAIAFLGEERKELALVSDVLKSIRVTGKGKVVGLSARLTADSLKELFGKGD